MSDSQDLSILVIDGENSIASGVSAPLVVLEEMVQRLAHDEDLPDHATLPCKYFDLIVGSGEGGWIAMMLGRLEMPVSRCIEVYNVIRNSLHSLRDSDERSRTDEFERLLKDLIRRETGGLNPDGELLNPLEGEAAPTSPLSCKTAILTSTAGNIFLPTPFRTYKVRDNRTSNCPVWMAIRAAAATPSHFAPIEINTQLLVSAAHFGDSNPIEFALSEAATVFGKDRHIGYIVSLGAGHPGHIFFNSSLATSYSNATVRIAQDSERKAQEVARRLSQSGINVYFRFNVEQGLQWYTQEQQNLRTDVRTHAMAYISQHSVGDNLDAVVRKLRRVDDSQQHQPVPGAFPLNSALSSSLLPFSTSLPMQAYVYELYEASRGLPLWEPQPPHQSKPVEIGDVGHLNEAGAFEVLFNATVPAKKQRSEGFRVPPRMEPFTIDPIDLDIIPNAISPPFVARGNMQVTYSPLDDNVQRFSLTATRGAAVILHNPPLQIQLRPTNKIRDYIMENCQSWLHYYEKDPQGPRLIFQHSSLIFVTGVYQNAQWSLGAWSERHVTEVVSYSGTLSAKNELSGGWDPPPRHDTKHGPTERLEPLKPRLRPPEHPSLSLDEFSQASFVRGYVIGWRDLRNLEPKVVYPPPSWLELVVKVVKLGIPPSLRAAAESSSDSPRPPPSPPPPSQSTESVAVSSTEHDAEISSSALLPRLNNASRKILPLAELSGRKPPLHPCDNIITAVLKDAPAINFVIMHDDELIDMISHTRGVGTASGGKMVILPTSEDVLKMVLNIVPTHHYTENFIPESKGKLKVVTGTAGGLESNGLITRLLSLKKREWADWFEKRTLGLIDERSIKSLVVRVGAKKQEKFYLDVVKDVLSVVGVQFVSEQIAGLPLMTTANKGSISETEMKDKLGELCRFIFLQDDTVTNIRLRDGCRKIFDELKEFIVPHLNSISGKHTFNSMSSSICDKVARVNCTCHTFLQLVLGEINDDADIGKVATWVFEQTLPTLPLFAKALSLVVDYYLDNNRVRERAALVDAARLMTPSGDETVKELVDQGLKTSPVIPRIQVRSSNGVRIGGKEVNRNDSVVVAFPGGDLSHVDVSQYGLMSPDLFAKLCPKILGPILALPLLGRAPSTSGHFTAFVQSERKKDYGAETLYLSSEGAVTPFPESLVIQHAGAK